MAASQEIAARRQARARSWQAMYVRAEGLTGALAAAREARRQRAVLTGPARAMAEAAGQELRRRHPEAGLPPVAAA